MPDSKLVVLAEAAALDATKFDARLDSWMWTYDIVLLRSEAAASSQIEQLSASPRAILQAELGDNTRENAAQIAANTSALKAGLELAQDISAQSIRTVHRILMADAKHLTPGEFRDVPVWIGGDSPVEAHFVGAEASTIPDLMEDLTKFCLRTDVPVVVQAAIAHAQFETIHPFEDGNGRVGRALLHMLLRNTDVLSRAVLPISGELLKRSGEYYSALERYRNGQPEPIIRLFTDSLLGAVIDGDLLMKEIESIRLSWSERLEFRADSGVWKLLDYTLRQPVFVADSAMAELGMSQTSFYRFTTLLTEAGVLTRSKFFRDKDVWRSIEILEAMQNFADRAGFRKFA